MPSITFVQADGQRETLEAQNGQTLMSIAFEAGIEGIDAICGGGCSCATCHVVVDPAFAALLPEAEADERALLDGLQNAQATSRLSCQLRMTPELDGMALDVPAS